MVEGMYKQLQSARLTEPAVAVVAGAFTPPVTLARLPARLTITCTAGDSTVTFSVFHTS